MTKLVALLHRQLRAIDALISSRETLRARRTRTRTIWPVLLEPHVEPNLEHFSSITPCGISGPQFGVTSLVDLGLPVTMSDADAALRASFENVFGAVCDAPFPEFAQQLEHSA